VSDDIQLGEFCARFGAKVRDVRYILERGHVPEHVEAAPGSGRHRSFHFHQAVWLAIAVKLKKAGIPVDRAAAMATWATTKLRWSMREWYKSDKPLAIEFGDLYYFRLVHSKKPGSWYWFFGGYTSDGNRWKPDKGGIPAIRVEPLEDDIVIIRVNMREIANALVGVRVYEPPPTDWSKV
jgi:hypothetical protein